MTNLFKLAERCLVRLDGDRELDGDIAEALNLFPQDGRRWVRMRPEDTGGSLREPWRWYVPSAKWMEEERWPEWNAPTFTFSIECALALVPENWEWSISNRAPGNLQGRAYIHNKELMLAGMGGSTNPKYRGEEQVAQTPALALCAAALIARGKMT